MNTWNLLLHFLIIFDLVAFGIYFGGDILFTAIKYSLQGTTQGRYLTGGVPPVRFSM